nr:MinD/ParA family protein [Rhodococcus sp. ARC_M12]
MADRHENNWQPVRPLDDDVPEEHVASPDGPEPVVVATAVVAEPEPPREPFRSTPITMPPESVDIPTVLPPEAAAPAAPAARAAESPSKTGSVPADGDNDGTAVPTPAGVVDTATNPAVSTVERSPGPLPLEAKPTQGTPVGAGPLPVQNWAPQNWGPQSSAPQNWGPQNWGPHNQWVPQNQGAPRGQMAPPEQWRPQSQWAPQPGQWPQPPQQNQMHPNRPPMIGHGPGDAPVAPGAVPADGPGGAGGPGLQPGPPPVPFDLGSSLLVRSGSVPPMSGWRRALYLMSGGRIDVGNSAAQQRRLALTAQVGRPLVGCYRVAVLSLKGGVGKTTTTATLGSTFAELRGDRVIAIDANPDRGTLGQKVPSETTATVRNLLRDMHSLDRYSDVRPYTSQNAHRLEVLASDSDPATSEAFSGEDYDRAVALLEKFYSIVITDCGTGLMHSAMESILEGADTLVVVSSSSVDGVRSASATLDWLDAHGYRELVARSVAVVNGVRPRAGKVDLQKVVEHFEQRCAHVRTIPFDPHLEEGAEIELDRLRGRTRKALLEVAATVAAGFPDAPTAHRRD